MQTSGWLNGSMNRRTLLRRTAAAGLGLAALRGASGLLDPAAASAANLTLSYPSWMFSEPSTGKYFRDMSAAYSQAHPDVNIDLIQLPAGQYVEKIFTEVQGGQVPDILPLFTTQMPQYMQLDLLEPLDPYLDKSTFKSKLLPLQRFAQKGGKNYGIVLTASPQGLLIKDGTLLHGPTDRYALAIDRQNKIRFGIFHLDGRVVDGERSYRISQFNSWPAKYVAVITPDYGRLLPAAPEMTYAELAPLGGTKYRVVSIERAVAPIAVRFGLGFGPRISEPLPHPGDVVDVDYAIDPPVSDTVAAISSGPLLLKDGQWFEDPRAPAPDERNVQWPVIAIGTLADDTLLLAAVDGRHPERSIGMTRPEFGELLRGFGVLDAMALDSGGSVTMVSRAPGESAVTVRNVPSDDSAERYVSDGLFVYSAAPAGTIVVPRLGVVAKPAG